MTFQATHRVSWETGKSLLARSVAMESYGVPNRRQISTRRGLRIHGLTVDDNGTVIAPRMLRRGSSHPPISSRSGSRPPPRSTTGALPSALVEPVADAQALARGNISAIGQLTLARLVSFG